MIRRIAIASPVSQIFAKLCARIYSVQVVERNSAIVYLEGSSCCPAFCFTCLEFKITLGTEECSLLQFQSPTLTHLPTMLLIARFCSLCQAVKVKSTFGRITSGRVTSDKHVRQGVSHKSSGELSRCPVLKWAPGLARSEPGQRQGPELATDPNRVMCPSEPFYPPLRLHLVCPWRPRT